VWNAENLFTGWCDVGLTDVGVEEARRSGQLLGQQDDLDLRVVHTSVQLRAIATAEVALAEAGRSWLPVRRHWRLNERHYGALTGLDKRATAEKHGAEQVHIWRRSYDTPPPPVARGSEYDPAGDPRYRDVPRSALPLSECLADVVARMIPYFDDAIAADLQTEGARGGAVLVVAHGNSLRAMVKHLKGIADDEIAELDIPTGVPWRFRLADDLSVIDDAYLDPAAAAEGAAAVKRQAG
jgi:2,3-bisphosphoglycerate-dependent phosphoglycerate mutase